MNTQHLNRALSTLWSELVFGGNRRGAAFVLNSGDAGLLGALDMLSPDEASRNVNGGATIAAHAQHLRHGLAIMNRWAHAGGDPFADLGWDAAGTITNIDATQWEEIRRGLYAEAQRWHAVLKAEREVSEYELNGLLASIAHIAYHLGAIRQISIGARGPTKVTFSGETPAADEHAEGTRPAD